MKSRVFNIMQYVNHPDTYQPLLSEDQIKIALAHKTIKRWAYILHDKDHYSEKDFDDDQNHTVDKVKPPHWHIVCECTQQLEVHTIAKWFGIPENFIDCPKGAGAFLDCVEYLTHEETRQQELDKHHYDDSEVKANFDFRDELNKRAERRAKYGKDLDEKGQMLLDIQDHGMTLLQAWEKDSYLYAKNINLFEKARHTYLSHQPAPDLRLNFYVWSRHGGDGKGLASRALARSFFPGMKDDEIIFYVNTDTMFNSYDGQPVIIWNDFRAIDLLNRLGSRGSVFDVFDTHPVKQQKNVKYSTVNLVNCFNIVNSVQPYREFLDGLAGEYENKDGSINKVEDKSQAYRRFPLIMEVRLDSYEYLVNSGFMLDGKSYGEFESHKAVKAAFKNLHETLANNEKLLKEYEQKAILPVAKKVEEIKEKAKNREITAEEAEALFGDFGTEIEPQAIPIVNDIADSLTDLMDIQKHQEELLKDLRYKLNHDVCKYEMTLQDRQLVCLSAEGQAMIFEIIGKYGADAISIVDADSDQRDVNDMNMFK